MSDLGRVAVLAGGLSFEREVSLRSGTRVRDALLDAGVEAVILDVDGDLLPALQRETVDAALVLLHGASGEDGHLRTLLDLAGVPVVGTGPAACALSWDKPAARTVLQMAGVPVPSGLALTEAAVREQGHALLDLVVQRLGLPLVVKPGRGGSALGAAVVAEPTGLASALVAAFSYDGVALVERRVPGVEVAVTVLDTGDGPRALPAVEVVPRDGGLFDYAARYTPGRTEYHAPARLPDDVASGVAAGALVAASALDLRDLARIDGIVTPEGELVVLEVNTAPGMTDLSLTPLALRSAGLDVGPVMRDLLVRCRDRVGAPAH